MAWRRHGGYGGGWGGWRPYVPQWKRREQAARKATKLAKKGRKVEPVSIEGRTIARTFWGKAWCDGLERHSDYENRLPRGRTYVRNGSVVDLQISKGGVKALVSGSDLYDVAIKFRAMDGKRWDVVKRACSGKIASVVELLQGRLSAGVMSVLTAPGEGLIPTPGEIEMSCSCPDWATMCKHVAAVLYGVGARLDERPELLFLLRGVDQTDIVGRAAEAALAVAGTGAGGAAIEAAEMESLFGIEIDPTGAAVAPGAAAASGAAAPRGSPEPPRGKAPRGKEKVTPTAAKVAAKLAKVTATPANAPATPAKARRQKALAGKPPRGLRDAQVEPSAGPLEVRIADLRRHFLQKDTLTNSEYRALFSVPVVLATRELGRLAKVGFLIRRGAKRGTHYLAGCFLGPLS